MYGSASFSPDTGGARYYAQLMTLTNVCVLAGRRGQQWQCWVSEPKYDGKHRPIKTFIRLLLKRSTFN